MPGRSCQAISFGGPDIGVGMGVIGRERSKPSYTRLHVPVHRTPPPTLRRPRTKAHWLLMSRGLSTVLQELPDRTMRGDDMFNCGGIVNFTSLGRQAAGGDTIGLTTKEHFATGRTRQPAGCGRSP